MSSKVLRPRQRNVPHARENMTVKQRVFVSEYFADNELNATKAAERAGYGSPSNAASKLLSTQIIQRAIGVELRKRLENNEITAARVLKELGHIGFCDPIEMFSSDGSLRTIVAMPENMRRNIASYEIKSTRMIGKGENARVEQIIKVKLWPKTNALELIAKHLGMLDERFKVTHGIDPAAQAVLRSLLEKLEQQPSQVIDSSYIEHAAGSLPPIPSDIGMGEEIGEIIDGKVVKPK